MATPHLTNTSSLSSTPIAFTPMPGQSDLANPLAPEVHPMNRLDGLPTDLLHAIAYMLDAASLSRLARSGKALMRALDEAIPAPRTDRLRLQLRPHATGVLPLDFLPMEVMKSHSSRVDNGYGKQFWKLDDQARFLRVGLPHFARRAGCIHVDLEKCAPAYVKVLWRNSSWHRLKLTIHCTNAKSEAFIKASLAQACYAIDSAEVHNQKARTLELQILGGQILAADTIDLTKLPVPVNALGLESNGILVNVLGDLGTVHTLTAGPGFWRGMKDFILDDTCERLPNLRVLAIHCPNPLNMQHSQYQEDRRNIVPFLKRMPGIDTLVVSGEDSPDFPAECELKELLCPGVTTLHLERITLNAARVDDLLLAPTLEELQTFHVIDCAISSLQNFAQVLTEMPRLQRLAMAPSKYDLGAAAWAQFLQGLASLRSLQVLVLSERDNDTQAIAALKKARPDLNVQVADRSDELRRAGRTLLRAEDGLSQ